MHSGHPQHVVKRVALTRPSRFSGLNWGTHTLAKKYCNLDTICILVSCDTVAHTFPGLQSQKQIDNYIVFARETDATHKTLTLSGGVRQSVAR